MGNAIPIPILILLVLLAVDVPLFYEFRNKSKLDERQIQIGHFSSHIAYFVFSALLVFVILHELISTGHVEFYWYILLLSPMFLKFIICIIQSYGPVKSGLRGIFSLFFRGIVNTKLLDERQHELGNFSSHVAFYLYITLTLIFVIFRLSNIGDELSNDWIMLILVPILVKLFVSLFKTYGPSQGARFVCFTIAGFWLLFVLLSHGLSLGFIIEAIPFLLLVLITFLSKRLPLLAGIFFLILGIFSLVFFSGWYNGDMYFIIIMYSLIPFPILLSSVSFLLGYKNRKKQNEDLSN